MDQITPEQKKQLSAWSSQRDAMLLDLSKLKDEKEKLALINRNLADSNTEISEKIQRSIGKLSYIEGLDTEREKLVKKEVVEFIEQKSILQTEVSQIKVTISELSATKQGLIEDISMLMKVHSTVFKNTTELEKVITDIVSKCSGNAREVSDILKAVEDKFKDILKLSSLNIESHTQVLNEIPKLFVELRRKSLERDIINKKKTHE